MALHSFAFLFFMEAWGVACITATAHNMCRRGRLLPKLFLFGEQKASTTTLTIELARNSRIAFPIDDGSGQMSAKETHFFNIRDRYEKGLLFYTSLYPACPPTGQRMVGIDATPQIQTKHVVDRIVDTYRTSVPQLKFVIIFREPVARMQSAFYHAIRHNWTDIDFSTFPEYVNFLISPEGQSKVFDHGAETRIFWQTNYTGHLRIYYDAFEPEQLMLSTMGAALAPPPRTQSLAQVISSWLKIPMEGGTFGKKIDCHNQGEHPAIEGELSAAQSSKLQHLVYKMTGPGKVVVKIRDGTILYAYNGPGDFASKVDWLAGGW